MKEGSNFQLNLNPHFVTLYVFALLAKQVKFLKFKHITKYVLWGQSVEFVTLGIYGEFICESW